MGGLDHSSQGRWILALFPGIHLLNFVGLIGLINYIKLELKDRLIN